MTPKLKISLFVVTPPKDSLKHSGALRIQQCHMIRNVMARKEIVACLINTTCPHSESPVTTGTHCSQQCGDTLLKTLLTCTRLYRRRSSLCSGKSCIYSEPGLGYNRWIEIKYFPD